MAERPLIGLSPDQVSTNGMLGDLAFQDSNSAYIETIRGKVSLDKLDKSIEDTAVDIFVYDTRKDSDGGAWRKRTQHTSWYNETLNTATRGSRREFPAVAVIVVTANEIRIYDGDDPDLPMWMVFNSDSDSNITNGMSTRDFTAVTAVNGWIFFSKQSTTGLTANIYGQLNFIFDGAEHIYAASAGALHYQVYNGGIGERNDAKGYGGIDNSLELLNADTDAWDVASTVLANAPIDEKTGLPIPTIAVATSNGVSIIKDDGTVVDMVSTATNNDVLGVKFIGDNKLLIRCQNSSTYANIHQASVHEIPSADESASFYSSLGSHIVRYTGADVASGLSITPASYTSSDVDIDHMEHLKTATTNNLAFGFNDRLTLVKETNTIDTIEDNASVAFATTSYNTGWMHGDIKGAFLSDTDATNVSADTLNSVNTFDGTFATSTGWTTDSDWTISGLVATCSGADAGRFIYPTTDRWPIGSSVVVEVTVTAYTSGTLYISYATGAATSGTDMTATGTYKFVNNVSGNDLIYFRSESFIGSIDNVKIYYAEYDRSVNNKGLIPYGTITKTPVATGAELVGYRPPSGAIGDNYLSRPLTSSDFDLTSDWSITFWAKKNEQTANNYSGFEIAEDDLTGNSAYAQIPFSIYIDVSGNTGWRGANVTGYQYNTLFDTQDVWKCVTTISKSGNLYIYVNGEYVTSTPATFANPSNPYSLGIFRFSYSESRHDGRRHIDYALFRMSNSAPSAEQIKKMYEDEKVLFQENAACTLYGSSDAVTALAYDDSTNLLYAGTSSGRSDFQGLRRINNTTTAVTTAMSASNGLVAEQ